MSCSGGATRRVAEFTHAISRVADSRGHREREEFGCLKANLEVPKMESRSDHAVKSARTQLTKMQWGLGPNGSRSAARGSSTHG
jgi:hypothetical protein